MWEQEQEKAQSGRRAGRWGRGRRGTVPALSFCGGDFRRRVEPSAWGLAHRTGSAVRSTWPCRGHWPGPWEQLRWVCA